ncbi:DNA-directed RNA polymerase I subunit rpa49 [Purpureocillium takamizusanense]|uniref:DNA-directed RNA polymerase I subunit rpa49 n=1 Tax=Purpureocillium takamizusanense TaxID=2060973 RepID=A0A9Q8QKE9_9HYPO|nr:DNA-directed RNA polymerase I subunit rpa49 [Purpureocillium takamizusanense]UNI21383.1 DNA-directed RNA polymerase I subunit rpa49 [Purpureocillium takamizusanense]
MGDGSGKKRKRDGESAGKPKKKVVLDAPAATAKVSSVLRPKSCPPVVATAPGLEIPKTLVFHSYQSKDEARTKTKHPKHAVDKELLLHSTAHRSLDYTAREEEPRGSKPLLKHYVGIYDPKTGKLDVVEAKKMVVRGQVRAKQLPTASAEDIRTRQTMMERKTDLGQTFGTKKAKKAIRENVLNAIAPERKPGDGSPTKIDNAARAMLDSVGALTSQMATREELQAVVDDAKPVPKANLAATDIQDVYDPDVIIGSDILNLVPIREWQEKARHKEGIQVPSRFIAARVNAIATNDDAVTRLRVLRYMGFVILFYLAGTKPGKQQGTRRVVSRDQLREVLSPAPEAVIENIRRKFSDAGMVRKYHIDLLMTHCCVFACIVDNFEVDTENLRDDLRISQTSINQFFHEIGGRVKLVGSKAQGRQAHIARLALPLDFPKQRLIAPRRK